MKRNVLLIMILFTSLVFSQDLLSQSPTDAIFDKFSGRDGITSVTITKHMFSLFADLKDEKEEDDFLDMASKLESIKILSVEKDTLGKILTRVDFLKEMKGDMKGQGFEELMVIKKSDQNVTFYIRKSGNRINELLMLTGGEKDNTMISIQGDIDLKNISEISRKMKIDGMENLGEMDKNKQK